MASQEMLNALSEEDPSTFRRALNYVKGLRGSGAPLAASANEAMMTALGPQGRKAVAPVAGLANVFSLGADVRDAMEFSGDTLESLKAGDFGKAGSDALYTAAAPFAMLLPGSLGGYKKVPNLWRIASWALPMTLTRQCLQVCKEIGYLRGKMQLERRSTSWMRPKIRRNGRSRRNCVGCNRLV